MGRKTWIPLILLIIGLVALGIAAGIPPSAENGPDSLGESMFALLCFALLLVLVSTQVLLFAVLPVPGFHPTSQKEGLLGAILLGVLLVIGFINLFVGAVEKSPFLIALYALGVSGTAWFEFFCIGHLLAQKRPVPFKVLWVTLLIVGNVVVMPVYWYIFVWRPHFSIAPRRAKASHPWLGEGSMPLEQQIEVSRFTKSDEKAE
jgi:hypothetical protein